MWVVCGSLWDFGGSLWDFGGSLWRDDILGLFMAGAGWVCEMNFLARVGFEGMGVDWGVLSMCLCGCGCEWCWCGWM